MSLPVKTFVQSKFTTVLGSIFVLALFAYDGLMPVSKYVLHLSVLSFVVYLKSAFHFTFDVHF